MDLFSSVKASVNWKENLQSFETHEIAMLSAAGNIMNIKSLMFNCRATFWSNLIIDFKLEYRQGLSRSTLLQFICDYRHVGFYTEEFLTASARVIATW